TAAWLAAPLAALPLGVAEGIWLALMIGCVVGTLLLLGVRDWRCHMVAFLWLPTYSALQTGNLALPLALGIAAVWRYRDRRVVAGLYARRLSPLWLVPLALWVGPQGSANGRPWQTALVLCLVAFVFVVAPFASSRA